MNNFDFENALGKVPENSDSENGFQDDLEPEKPFETDYKSEHERELWQRTEKGHKWGLLPYEDLVNIDDGTKYEILTRIINIENLIHNSSLLNNLEPSDVKSVQNAYKSYAKNAKKVNYYLGREYSGWNDYSIEREKERLLNLVSIGNSTAREAYNSLKAQFPESTEKSMFVPEQVEEAELTNTKEGYNFFVKSLSKIHSNIPVIEDIVAFGIDSHTCSDLHQIFNEIPGLNKVKNLKELLHIKISAMATGQDINHIDDTIKASDMLDDYFDELEGLEQQLPEFREKFIEVEEQLIQEERETAKYPPTKKNIEFINKMCARYMQLSAKATYVDLLFKI